MTKNKSATLTKIANGPVADADEWLGLDERSDTKRDGGTLVP